MIRVTKYILWVSGFFGLFQKRLYQVLIEIMPGGIERLLSLIVNTFFGFFKRLDLLRRQRRRFRCDPIVGTASSDPVNVHTGADFESKQLQVAEPNLVTGGSQCRTQEILWCL